MYPWQTGELDRPLIDGALLALDVGKLVATISDLEGVEMMVEPTHRRLDDPMEVLEVCVARDVHAPPDRGLAVGDRDEEPVKTHALILHRLHAR